MPGIGEAKAAQLVAAFELGRRLLADWPSGRWSIRGPDDVAERLILQMGRSIGGTPIEGRQRLEGMARRRRYEEGLPDIRRHGVDLGVLGDQRHLDRSPRSDVRIATPRRSEVEAVARHVAHQGAAHPMAADAAHQVVACLLAPDISVGIGRQSDGDTAPRTTCRDGW